MTPNLEALRDLLVKARAAKEGSRELDAAVAVAFRTEGANIYAFFRCTSNHPAASILIPAYTTRPLDLTAVVGLVKEGWIWDVTSTGTAWVMDPNVVPCGSQWDAKAPTPALALLIAVIEAWIYELENEND